MSRQKVLERADPPRLWVVLDEAALRRPIGGPKVMRGQLEHLIAVAAQSNITVQVMPLWFGSPVVEGGAFSILRFPDPDLPDVVYLEQLGGAVYRDKREDVERYLEAADRLGVDGLTPEATVDAIEQIARET